MFMKKALVSALLAAGIIGAVAMPLPSVAATSFDVQLNFGPPPARYERIPNPRAGYVWSPGNWQWNGNANRHVWVAGHWEQARVGYVYHAPRWTDRNGRWYYETSRWDSDGDGVPNRLDPTPFGAGLTVAPPPPRDERVAARRAGYVWSPGYWEWRANRHDWIAGHWQSVRPGFTYYAAHWVERNGRWHMEPRRWERDRDGDGVPDRLDARPNNPNRS